jgi:hypothetical protein
MLSYLFWPNPPAVPYENPKVIALLGLTVLFFVLSLVLRCWRRGVHNAVTRTLSRSWASACIGFGAASAVLTVARVEQISYVSMRFWWVIWGVALTLYVLLHLRRWRTMHYEVLPREESDDPREKYLPRRKRK